MGLFDWIERRLAAQRQRLQDEQNAAQKREAEVFAYNQEQEEKERQRLLSIQQEVTRKAEQKAEAERAAKADAAARRPAVLEEYERNARGVIKACNLISSGRRTEAVTNHGPNLVGALIERAENLGLQRAAEFTAILPYWDDLITYERDREYLSYSWVIDKHKSASSVLQTVLSMPRDSVDSLYSMLVDNRLPDDVRAAFERASNNHLHGVEGDDWENTGAFLGCQNNGRPIGYEGEGNILTIAPPGSGKSQCHVLPNILLYDGPMLVLDIKKSENYRESKAAHDLLMCHKIGEEPDNSLWQIPLYKFDPANPADSVIYNPLEFLPKDIDQLWSAAGRMAEWLCVPSKESDSYFDDRARQWTRGLVAAIVTISKDTSELPNVGQLADFVFDDSDAQNVFLAQIALREEKPLANLAKNILSTSERERSATMNTIARSLEPWQDPIIQRLTSGKSTWSPSKLLHTHTLGARYDLLYIPNDVTVLGPLIGDEYVTETFPRLFICMPAGDVKAATSVVRVIIGQHVDALMERENSRDEAPIMFMLDEFPQLGRMESIMRGVEMGRSAGLRFWFFAQDLQQIARSYPPEDAAVITGSCAMQCYMNISTAETADAVSRRLGETRNFTTQAVVPICPPDELMNSPHWADKILCLRRQQEPVVLRKKMFKDLTAIRQS